MARHCDWTTRKIDINDWPLADLHARTAQALAVGGAPAAIVEESDMLTVFTVLEPADPKPTYVSNGLWCRQFWGDVADLFWVMAQGKMPESAQQVQTFGLASTGFAGCPSPTPVAPRSTTPRCDETRLFLARRRRVQRRRRRPHRRPGRQRRARRHHPGRRHVRQHHRRRLREQAVALVVEALAMGLVLFVPMVLERLGQRMGVDVPPPTENG
ncbi:MAG: hypothetical protein ACRD0A_16165 [Acidimicrobiales bacterium]